MRIPGGGTLLITSFPELIQLYKGFRRAYKKGECVCVLGGGGLITELKKRFKTSYITLLIEILFEFTGFFKLQNVIKSRISLNINKWGAYIPRAYSRMYFCCCCCLKVDGLKLGMGGGWLISGELGAYNGRGLLYKAEVYGTLFLRRH